MGCFGGKKSSSHPELWRDTQVVVCFCAPITQELPGLTFYRIPKERRIQREYVRLLRNVDSVKSPQAHLLTSASHFCFFALNSTFHFALLSCSTSLSATFVFHSRPPNDPTDRRARSVGPRLSLFSEVSYTRPNLTSNSWHYSFPSSVYSILAPCVALWNIPIHNEDIHTYSMQ